MVWVFSLKFLVKEAFNRMIWVFETAEKGRIYSLPVEITGVDADSAVTFNAAFGNGHDGTALTVNSIDAIFTADGVTSYFTNPEADMVK
jgi:hypothetical protein